MGIRSGRLLACFALVTTGLLALPAVAGAAGGGAPPGVRSDAAEAGVGATPASCSESSGPHVAHCYLSVEGASQSAMAVPSTTKATLCKANKSAGWTACNLESAYGIKKDITTHGNGNLVAVIEAYDDPTAESDLATYRTANKLPACTTSNGCFEKVNQTGQASNYPSPDSGWASEASLDMQMVSAICPLCHILVVEANSSGFGDLAAAENEAVALGARVMSNSWGSGEYDGESGYDSNLEHPGVDITFSSGDGSYQGGVQYPSASPFVTSVGGTQLKPATNARGWKETAWVNKSSNPPTQGSGSGCSSYELKPSWQSDAGCPNRMTADVERGRVQRDVLRLLRRFRVVLRIRDERVVTDHRRHVRLGRQPTHVHGGRLCGLPRGFSRLLRHHQGHRRLLHPDLLLPSGPRLRRSDRTGLPGRLRGVQGARDRRADDQLGQLHGIIFESHCDGVGKQPWLRTKRRPGRVQHDG